MVAGSNPAVPAITPPHQGWSTTVDRVSGGFESRWGRQFCPVSSDVKSVRPTSGMSQALNLHWAPTRSVSRGRTPDQAVTLVLLAGLLGSTPRRCTTYLRSSIGRALGPYPKACRIVADRRYQTVKLPVNAASECEPDVWLA